MKAAVIAALGRPPVYDDFADPVARDGAVVVTVEAAALKNLDRGLVAGTHYGSAHVPLPSVAGVDGVARMADGRLVYTSALAPFGMMAERALVDQSRIVELPAGVEPVLAAAVPNAGISAWFSLEYAARAQPGANVLVLGATGVTGSLAAQLAKAQFGAGRVVVAGRNTGRLEWLRTAGADAVITLGGRDETEQVAAEHESHPIDVVLDYLWGRPAEQLLTALGNTGLHSAYHATRFVQIGSMAGPTLTLPSAILRSAGVELVGSGLGSVPAEAQARVASEYLPRLFELIADGQLQLQTEARELRQVEELWEAPQPAGTRIVFVP